MTESMMAKLGLTAADLKTKNNDERLEKLIDIFSVVRTPSDKIGYDWEIIKIGDLEVQKKYVAQDNQQGTADNPIIWVDGMTPIMNAYYLIDGVRYVWMGEWVEF